MEIFSTCLKFVVPPASSYDNFYPFCFFGTIWVSSITVTDIWVCSSRYTTSQAWEAMTKPSWYTKNLGLAPGPEHRTYTKRLNIYANHNSVRFRAGNDFHFYMVHMADLSTLSVHPWLQISKNLHGALFSDFENPWATPHRRNTLFQVWTSSC